MTFKILNHWQKLGQFRGNHPSVGAGIHKQITSSPYVFSRDYSNGNYYDKVVVGLDLPFGKKEISVGTIFENGTKVKDAYSGTTSEVINGKVAIDSEFGIVLLEKN
jgi:alpha-amylase